MTRFSRFLPILLAAVVLVAWEGLLLSNATQYREINVRIAIPLHADDPGSAWSQAIRESSAVGAVILNPSNGPGVSRNPQYASWTQQAQSKGIRVLGYVYTAWADGSVSSETAKSWVDDYYTWYNVDGIFIDAANDTCYQSVFNYYHSLYSYIKARHGPDLVFLNPGKETGECYASISDVLLTFENNYDNYTENYMGANWTYKYPSSRFFHIVLDVPSDRMHEVISQAIDRGAGWVYITDLGEFTKNPYSVLPSYFESEARDVDLRNPTNSPAAYNYVTGVLFLGVVAATVLASAAIFVYRTGRVTEKEKLRRSSQVRRFSRFSSSSPQLRRRFASS